MPDVASVKTSLLDSAFAFLRRAISDFEQDHRFSVVNFAIATELFLKARLIEEHWSLLFKDVDKATPERFERGEFQSISISQSLTRLNAIAGVNLSAETEETILKIAGHRNRVVHFTIHPGPDKDEAASKAELAVEQLNGWLHLQKLLKQWFGSDEQLFGTLWQIDASMKKHRDFLEVVFAAREEEIEKRKQAGSAFRDCAVCSFPAAEVDELTDNFASVTCLVCNLSDSLISVKCPDCENPLEATGYDATYPTCKKCNHELTEDELRGVLDTDEAEYFEHVEKNCAECMGYHTVVEHDEIYVCLQCFGYADELDHCQWCNEGQINGGDLEFSYHAGCEFCDGHGGWDKD